LRDKRLAARFFFSKNSTATSIISHFCIAVAKDMADQVPMLRAAIEEALDETPTSYFSLRQQFERLIIVPIRNAVLPFNLLIVIDAIDNCDADGRAVLLECITDHLASVQNLRILLTSRPLSDIDDLLYQSPLVHGVDIQLLDIHDKEFADIHLYINKRLPRLALDHRETLVAHSGGLFIWAATACRMLKRSRRPAELMTRLLGAKTAGHLDELYLEALRQAVVDRDAHDLMMSVLQLIIASFQPISISTIEALLPHNTHVDAFVQDLGALLKDGHPERPIFVIHSTFREFIAQADRANGFLVDLPTSHASMAIACIDFLSSLDYDILGVRGTNEAIPRNVDIENLEVIVNQSVTAAIKYASSYWAHHAIASRTEDEVWRKVLRFLSTKLLAWIELMSWRSNVPGCILGLSQLHARSKQLLGFPQRILVSISQTTE
jgi:hypothetical protein